jgi:hypothetical protein
MQDSLTYKYIYYEKVFIPDTTGHSDGFVCFRPGGELSAAGTLTICSFLIISRITGEAISSS